MPQQIFSRYSGKLTNVIISINKLIQESETLILSHDDIQFVMYMCTNSVGSSTAVVSLFTTSME